MRIHYPEKKHPLLRNLGCDALSDMGEDDPSVPLLSSAPSKVASNATQLLADWWLWEAIEASTGIFALSIIAIILFIYDGSALPDWPSIFTVRS